MDLSEMLPCFICGKEVPGFALTHYGRHRFKCEICKEFQLTLEVQKLNSSPQDKIDLGKIIAANQHINDEAWILDLRIEKTITGWQIAIDKAPRKQTKPV